MSVFGPTHQAESLDSLEDLEYTNQHGYVKGLSQIFTKHLVDVGEKQRPIHCSDRKRLQFYVKEGDTWDKDPQNTKIDINVTSDTILICHSC